jgi:hypothetical protein
MADRRYDEKEVGNILQRAAEIQAGLTPEGASDGLTLEDLQKVAAEVGIDPTVVDRAAREVRTGPPEKLVSGANTIMLDRTVSGVVTEEVWDEMVTRLRRHVGKPGRINAHGHTYEWWGGWDTGGLMLTTTSRHGKTRIKLMGETTGGSVLGWTLGLCLGFVTSIATGAIMGKSHQNGWLIFVVVMMVIAMSAFFTDLALRFWRRKMIKGMERVFDDVSDLVDPSPNALPMEAALILPPDEERPVFHV